MRRRAHVCAVLFGTASFAACFDWSLGPAASEELPEASVPDADLREADAREADAPVDATSAGDADAEADAPLVFECPGDAVACKVVAERCCGGGGVWQCQDAGAPCPAGTNLACAGRAECGSEYCCLFPAGNAFSACATSCSGVILCRNATDCPDAASQCLGSPGDPRSCQ